MKILFIHHSTGANLLKEGELRRYLNGLNPDLELWDHSYNYDSKIPLWLAKLRYRTGLSNDKGEILKKDFNIFIDNNSPIGYLNIFTRDVADYTLSQILNFDLIVFKTCYPTSQIEDVQRLMTLKTLYIQIRESLRRFQDKKFILLTPPPLRRSLTKPENAKRARDLADWLASGEFQIADNLQVFDFFHLLADDENYLRKEYCRLVPIDGHPNKKANRIIGPLFADFIAA